MDDTLCINTLDLCFEDCARFTLEVKSTLIVRKFSWEGPATEANRDRSKIHKILSFPANSFRDHKELNANLR